MFISLSTSLQKNAKHVAGLFVKLLYTNDFANNFELFVTSYQDMNDFRLF